MNRNIRILTFIVSLISLISLKNNLRAEINNRPSKIKKDKISFVAYPMAFYSAGTGLAGGIASRMLFNEYTDRKISSLSFMGYYTEQGQYSMKLKPEVYLNEEKYRLSGLVEYKYKTSSYYGIGNDTALEDEVLFASKFINIQLSAQRMIFPNFYFGFQYQLAHNRITDSDNLSLIGGSAAQVSDEGISSGFGALITFDTRNNNIYPLSGNLMELSAITYHPYLGSDYPFHSYMIDLCNYQTLFSNHVLAFQGVAGITLGDPPFYMMNDLEDTLRGFSNNRFVDKNMFALQAEYRLPLFGRFGMVGFVGLGQVFDELSNFSIGEFIPSAGLGLRVKLIKGHNINLRIDYGKSSVDSSFDIKFMEAF
jgi:hypothetical protein